jgi:ABC-type multidrug transport system ATPase subunit
MSSAHDQLKIILKKNIWLQKRSPCGLVCNLLLPIILGALAGVIFRFGFMMIYDISDPVISASNPSKFTGFSTSRGYANCWLRYNASSCFIGVTPDSSSTITHLNDILNQTALNLVLNDPSSIYLGSSVHYKLYPDSDALQKAYLDSEGKMWSALEFSGSDKQVQYTIRFNDSVLPSDYKPCTISLQTGEEYDRSGYLAVQIAVEQALMQHYVESHGLTFVKPTLEAHYSLTTRTSDSVNNIVVCFLPSSAGFFMTFAFLSIAIVTTNQLLREKQSRMKEFMKMMGLRESIYWLSWLITYLVPITLASIMITVIIYSINSYYLLSNPIMLFLLVFLFGTSITTFGFFLASVLKSTKVATTFTVLYFYLISQVSYFLKDAPRWVRILTALLSPLAYQFGITEYGAAEFRGSGVSASSAFETGDFSFGASLVMLAVDTLLYSFLAWYFSNVLPGDFGIKKPAHFLFTRAYWAPRHDRELLHDEDATNLMAASEDYDSANFEPVSADMQDRVGVSIHGLTKLFRDPNEKTITAAVNNMSLDMYKGQILSLLGHNGAGKSTTVSILTGLYPPTSGHAYVNGLDISQKMDEIRRHMGLCPQQDLLFDELTGKEHLLIFGRLRGIPARQLERDVAETLRDVELEDKQNTLVKNYSGGMKRRLNVAISLLGDARVVFLDEPTSGLDPVSRRGLWNLLKQKKEGRTIILTTHFMEEADILGDRIAIMANGKVKCCGSPLFLKNRFGIGYYLTIAKNETARDDKAIEDIVQGIISDATVASETDNEIVMLLPLHTVKLFPTLLRRIEEEINQNKTLGIEGYGISMTSLEDVFLKITHEDYEARHEGKKKGTFTLHVRDAEKEDEERRKEFNQKLGVVELSAYRPKDAEMSELLHRPAPKTRQFKVLLKKRAINDKRNWKASLLFVLLPSLFIAITLGLTKLQTQNNVINQATAGSDFAAVPINYQSWFPFSVPYTTYVDNNAPDGINIPPLSVSLDPLWGQFKNIPEDDLKFIQYSNASALEEAIMRWTNSRSLEFGTWRQHHGGFEFYNVNYTTNSYGFYLPVNVSETTSLPTLINLFNNALLSKMLSDGGVDGNVALLNMTDHPLDSTGYVGWGISIADPTQNIGNILYFIVAFFFGFCIIGGILGKAIVVDKEFQIRLQMNLMGVDKPTYWFSNYLVDVIMIFIAGSIMAGIAAAFETPLFLSPVGLQVYFAVLALLTLAFAISNYIIGSWFNKSEDCLKWIIILNFASVALPVMLRLIIQIIAGRVSPNAYDVVSKATSYLPDMFPLSSLSLLLFDLLSISSKDLETMTWEKIFDTQVTDTKKKLIALAIQTVVFWAILFIIDYFAMKIRRMSRPPAQPSYYEPEDNDVTREKQRMTNHHELSDPIKAVDVYKSFGKNQHAVRGISFGVTKGECFGLLGPNGAGKTTTMSMLTAQLGPSFGEIILAENSIYSSDLHTLYRKAQIGYCLQSNQALSPYLTVREHLELYLGLRSNFSEHQMKAKIDEMIERMDLEQYTNRMAKNLSGGNKRKLSVAVAMLTGYKIVFMDEPSTGMDPGARRSLWSVITEAKGDTVEPKCIVLTTHSMEEAEAVCNRIAIMVKGKMRCLGSNQHLKNKFGSGYRLVLNIKEEFAGHVHSFVSQLFPGSVLLEAVEGFRTYDVGRIEGKLSMFFEEIEKYKDSVGINNYSMSQTSLEQVFLHLAKQQEN